jgi:hypothetical protein
MMENVSQRLASANQEKIKVRLHQRLLLSLLQVVDGLDVKEKHSQRIVTAPVELKEVDESVLN